MAGVKGRSGGHLARSIADHQRRGTYKAHRHGGVRNPGSPSGRPTKPEGLDGLAGEEWDRMVSRLELMGTIAVVDDAALEQCCRLYQETEELREAKDLTAIAVARLEENQGAIGPEDLLAFFQELGKMRRLEASYRTQLRQGRLAMRMYLTEFGLTHLSRGRVRLPEAPASDGKTPGTVTKLAEFLG